MAHHEADELIAQFHMAASGALPWGVPLEALRVMTSAKLVTLHGLLKSSQSVAFSFEVGDLPAQAALDFILKYHKVEPRTPLIVHEPVGHVVSCHHHLDEAFIATDPYHQEFWLPYGMRYCTVLKAHEDDELLVLCGVHRGVGMQPLDEAGVALVRRLGRHLPQALRTYLRLNTLATSARVGMEVLRRLPQAVLLVDEARRVVFANDAALDTLASHPAVQRRDGLLSGPDAQSDAQILTALRSLRLGSGAYLGEGREAPAERAFVRLEAAHGTWLGVHCHALRATDAMGAFGSTDLALVWLHDPTAVTVPDSFIVASMWDLTPAEAQVMVGLGQGCSAQELADQRGVALATVRSQVQSLLKKTGADNQAALVRMLSDMPSFLR